MRYNNEDEERVDRRRKANKPSRDDKRKGNKGEIKESLLSSEDDDLYDDDEKWR